MILIRIVSFALLGATAFARYDLDHDVVHASRAKRYVLSRRRWPSPVLTWKLHNDHITPADRFIVRNTLHRAFALWASASPLRFIEIPEAQSWRADINIIFVKGRHGDSLPFDGPRGIVAHAFYPTEGELHFDADEKWTLNSKEGINLFQTAVHEIGHLLGLEHSTDSRAAMHSARAVRFDPGFELSDDDVRAVRALYALVRPPRLNRARANWDEIKKNTVSDQSSSL
uniref:ZnMc domain-containing protein n=1 Tax=Steinernema glaseri TaxID=37863 RepID=A0A1I8A8D0_9BILA